MPLSAWPRVALLVGVGALVCTTSADCSADGRPYCDEDAGVCVECLGDANCGGDQAVCGPAHQCVECVSDMHCGGGDPYCRAETHRCVECLTDANCGPDGRCDGDFQCSG